MSNKKVNVAAVVVTYNRKELLSECIESILSQSLSVKKLIIIDNASTDNTEDFIREKGLLDNKRVIFHKMSTNTGGAGGFYEGLKIVREMGCFDWAWIMDDDTIPERECLEKLIDSSSVDENASFFASCVKGVNNEPMNVPYIDERPCENGYPDWYMNLNKSMVKITKATFVSLLIKNAAIVKCGLPCKDYFIWGDDFEYTTRLTKYYGNAYLVGESWVCHKRFNAKTISIENETEAKRINNYFYSYRNTMINKYLYEGRKGYYKQFLKYVSFSFKILIKKSGLKKFRIINKGLFASLMERRKYKKYLKEQLN